MFLTSRVGMEYSIIFLVVQDYETITNENVSQLENRNRRTFSRKRTSAGAFFRMLGNREKETFVFFPVIGYTYSKSSGQQFS